MSVEGAGQPQHWTARRFVVRLVRQAQAAETALCAYLAKVMVQLEALNQRGRGKKHFAEVPVLRQVVVTIVQRYRVEEFLWLRFHQHTVSRAVQAYRG